METLGSSKWLALPLPAVEEKDNSPCPGKQKDGLGLSVLEFRVL